MLEKNNALGVVSHMVVSIGSCMSVWGVQVIVELRLENTTQLTHCPMKTQHGEGRISHNQE